IEQPDARLGTAAVVAALVFGVHPLRVEPVAWVTGRADLLCATFVLLSTLAYLRAVESADATRRVRMMLCVVAFAAALLSKGSALPLPVVLLLLDVYPLRRVGRLGWPSLVREKALLGAVMIVGAAVIAYATRRGAVVTGTADYDVLARF